MKFFKSIDRKIVASGIVIALFAVLLYAVAAKFEATLAFLEGAWAFISPVAYGLILAYLLGPFARLIEKILPKKWSDNVKTHLGGIASLILVLVIILVFLAILLPSLTSSAVRFYNNFDSYVESVKGTIDKVAERVDFVEIDTESLIGSSSDLLGKVAKWLGDNVNLLLNYAYSLSGRIVNFIIVLAMTLYALFDRKNLKKGALRIEKVVFGEEKTEKINAVLTRGDYYMMKFLGTNLMDSLVIGVINFIFLGIVKADYQMLLAVILGVTNFIPTFGPIIGGIIGGLIILLTKPDILLIYIIFTLVLQQIEGNFIVPLLFADSTGLSPFWVLVSIVLGGKIFGWAGLVLGVPLTALISSIINEIIARKTSKKAETGTEEQSGEDPAPEAPQESFAPAEGPAPAEKPARKFPGKKKKKK